MSKTKNKYNLLYFCSIGKIAQTLLQYSKEANYDCGLKRQLQSCPRYAAFNRKLGLPLFHVVTRPRKPRAAIVQFVRMYIGVYIQIYKCTNYDSRIQKGLAKFFLPFLFTCLLSFFLSLITHSTHTHTHTYTHIHIYTHTRIHAYHSPLARQLICYVLHDFQPIVAIKKYKE